MCKDVNDECVPIVDGLSTVSSCAARIDANLEIPDFGNPCESTPGESTVSPAVNGPQLTPTTIPCDDGWWFDGAACFPCNKCTSGQRMGQACRSTAPTVCVDCESGTFMSEEWHMHTVCFVGNGCPGQSIYKNGDCPHTSFQPIHFIWLIIPGKVLHTHLPEMLLWQLMQQTGIAGYVAAASFITITGHGLR